MQGPSARVVLARQRTLALLPRMQFNKPEQVTNTMPLARHASNYPAAHESQPKTDLPYPASTNNRPLLPQWLHTATQHARHLPRTLPLSPHFNSPPKSWQAGPHAPVTCPTPWRPSLGSRHLPHTLTAPSTLLVSSSCPSGCTASEVTTPPCALKRDATAPSTRSQNSTSPVGCGAEGNSRWDSG